MVRHLPDYLQPVMRMAYLTGWRTKSELLPLEWQHVRWEDGLITLPGEWTKNGEDRVYPFDPELTALLRARKQATEQ